VGKKCSWSHLGMMVDMGSLYGRAQLNSGCPKN